MNNFRLKGIFSGSSLFMRIFSFLFLLAFGLTLSVPVVAVAGFVFRADSYAFLQFSQASTSLFVFVFPVAAYLWLFFPQQGEVWFSLKRKASWQQVVLSVLLVLVSIPFLNWLTAWNEGLSLPSSLSELQEWMRLCEDEASALTERFLSVNSVGGLLLNLLSVALIPAVCEELFFRGFLQNIFSERMSAHAAVWLSAFLFSFIHFQFFGFFPRLLLGVAFGYLYFSTGSLWMPVLAHFVNNALVVAATVLCNWGAVPAGFDSFGTDSFILIMLSALLALNIIVFLWRKRAVV